MLANATQLKNEKLASTFLPFRLVGECLGTPEKVKEWKTTGVANLYAVTSTGSHLLDQLAHADSVKAQSEIAIFLAKEG